MKHFSSNTRSDPLNTHQGRQGCMLAAIVVLTEHHVCIQNVSERFSKMWTTSLLFNLHWHSQTSRCLFCELNLLQESACRFSRKSLHKAHGPPVVWWKLTDETVNGFTINQDDHQRGFRHLKSYLTRKDKTFMSTLVLYVVKYKLALCLKKSTGFC